MRFPSLFQHVLELSKKKALPPGLTNIVNDTLRGMPAAPKAAYRGAEGLYGLHRSPIMYREERIEAMVSMSGLLRKTSSG